ncbi:MAG: tRNA (N6-isopentenyl adenosine(37)-C2)-methylthiotransferase MiaB [Magnetovibrio sp.]|nr:tRNA (N6-isopentenyl adenosine(37)-C2)-methylthiotransferase MiaB [Magnetovibrio sp.]
MAKKLHIQTYGCQMNVYDSERIAEVLAPLGYVLSDTSEDADMVILNTCHIREKAAEKVYSKLGRLRKQKEKKEQTGGRMILGVTGCVAQAEGSEVLRRAPYVDMVFGPQTYHRLPEMVAKASRANGHVLDTDFPEDNKFDSLPKTRTAEGATAYLSIQEGCDKFCTYCVVPYTRGAEYSRPTAQVLDEARALIKAGVSEITLLGQNVNAYHGENEDGSTCTLADLVRKVATLDGLDRIRYLTSYPAEMTDDLILAHAEVTELMPYLHLPIQAGSDQVLKAMNRQHTVAEYKLIVEKLRKAVPGIALSSDFIVGFPGETDADFEETMALVEEMRFIQAYSFKYSSRPGTPAALLESQDLYRVPEALKAERLARLQALLNANTLAFNKQAVGQTYPVLLDRTGKTPGMLVGRSPYMQAVVVKAEDHLLNTLQNVLITEAGPNSLNGELVETLHRALA